MRNNAKSPSTKHLKELYELLAVIKSPAEAKELVEDLLTPQEVASLAERWQLIQLLAGGMPQREISQKLGISISKVTRGSRVMQYGTGAFHRFLKRLGRRAGIAPKE